MRILAGVFVGAFVTTLVWLASLYHRQPIEPVAPTRDALASALFARYGNVRVGEPSVTVPSGPTNGFRLRHWWLEDADAVLAFVRRYPRG